MGKKDNSTPKFLKVHVCMEYKFFHVKYMAGMGFAQYEILDINYNLFYLYNLNYKVVTSSLL